MKISSCVAMLDRPVVRFDVELCSFWKQTGTLIHSPAEIEGQLNYNPFYSDSSELQGISEIRHACFLLNESGMPYKRVPNYFSLDLEHPVVGYVGETIEADNEYLLYYTYDCWSDSRGEPRAYYEEAVRFCEQFGLTVKKGITKREFCLDLSVEVQNPDNGHDGVILSSSLSYDSLPFRFGIMKDEPLSSLEIADVIREDVCGLIRDVLKITEPVRVVFTGRNLIGDAHRELRSLVDIEEIRRNLLRPDASNVHFIELYG